MIDRLIVNVLEWAAGHTDEGRYSPVAIVFHWTMAALVLFQLFWGWWMGRLPVGGDKVAAHDLHYLVGVLMLVLAMVAMGLLGALLTFTGQPVYAPHLLTTAAWGLSPLEDQQAAGLIMWAPAAAVYLAAALWVLGRWIGPDARPSPA